MDYAAQWKAIITEGSFSREALLVRLDGEAVSLRGMESAGDNGRRDAATGKWSYEMTDSYHSLTVSASNFEDALGTNQVSDCAIVIEGKRYRIAGVTGTGILGQALRLWLKPIAEEDQP